MSGTPLHQCALVTGASSGLGEEFALQLASGCQRMVLVARRKERLQMLETRLRIANPDLMLGSISSDLTIEADRRDLIDHLIGTEWTPTLLVNNAGMGEYGEFRTASWDKLQEMIDLNVTALSHLAHGFLPGMVEERAGAIVNVSSLAGELPIPDIAIYAATKAFVTSFSDALRLEVREHGISVLAVCPGPVHTEFGDAARRPGEANHSRTREKFYVAKEQVVSEALAALRKDRPRVYPGWRVNLVAKALSVMPAGLVRHLMKRRPRRAAPQAGNREEAPGHLPLQ